MGTLALQCHNTRVSALVAISCRPGAQGPNIRTRKRGSEFQDLKGKKALPTSGYVTCMNGPPVPLRPSPLWRPGLVVLVARMPGRITIVVESYFIYRNRSHWHE